MDPQDPRPSDAPEGASPPTAPESASPPTRPDGPAPEVADAAAAMPSADEQPPQGESQAPASEVAAGPLPDAPAADAAAPSDGAPPAVAAPATPVEAAPPTPAAAGPVEPATADPAPAPAPEPAPVSAVPAAVYAPPAAAAVPVPTTPPAAPPTAPPAAADASSGESPAADPSAGAGGADTATARGRRGVGVLPLALLCLGALLLAAGTVFLALQLREESQTDEARVEALDASRDAARLLFSYNHETLDDDFSKGLAVTTGDFRDEYQRTTQDVVKDVATQYEAVVRAEVNEAGVISASPDEVTTLVFLNQVTTSTRVEGEKIDQSRVRMRLVERNGRWLVDKVDAL